MFSCSILVTVVYQHTCSLACWYSYSFDKLTNILFVEVISKRKLGHLVVEKSQNGETHKNSALRSAQYHESGLASSMSPLCCK